VKKEIINGLTYYKGGKPIKSTDPRKRKIMDAFKKKTGATKITCVRETKDEYIAHCQTWTVCDEYSTYDSLGDHKIAKDEI